MKKRNIIPVLLVILLLSACGVTNKADTRNPEDAELISESRHYNENMTLEQFQEVTNQLVTYLTSLGDSFSSMSDLCVKYADAINSVETFDWSQYWDFRETKADVEQVCEEILQYDDSECSAEYQLCFDEIKSIAFSVLCYFHEIDGERSIDELNFLMNQIDDKVESGMSDVIVYQTKASIAYTEMNDGDEATIQELKDSISPDSVINIAYPTGSGQFTNKFGTVDTKCAHSDCNNAIASTGDTDCCIIHSNKCLNCGKYIDGDAVFCMDCIEGTLPTAIVHSGGCKYRYFDGSTCGQPVSDGMTLCEEHFKELDNIYNDLVKK